ncbi:MAG: hypothetical protein HQL95_07235 [Magnetococcales bacterium]|nr:hypothetical protein [Magnetococcales bacterium]
MELSAFGALFKRELPKQFPCAPGRPRSGTFPAMRPALPPVENPGLKVGIPTWERFEIKALKIFYV